MIAREAAQAHFVTAEAKGFVWRILELRCKVRKLTTEGVFDDCDLVELGFLPQLVLPFVRSALKSADRAGGVRPVIVSDFFLSLYDTVVLDRKLVRAWGLIARLLHRIDERTLKASDVAFTDTEANRAFVLDEFKLRLGEKPSVHTLYLEADRKFWKNPASDRELEVKTGSAGRDSAKYSRNIKDLSREQEPFIVLYFGTGLPLQGIDVILKAMAQAERELPEQALQFIFVGGLKKTEREMFAEIPYAVHIPWLSEEALRDVIAESDLCLAGHFREGDGKQDRTIPGKAVIFEAMNKPMLLGDSTANHERYEADERHVFVRRGDAQALALAVEEQVRQWKNTEQPSP
ncbi:MAG: glycosyltransferase [Lachnospiraceae bacterium]|nr:glycosyltransferase [Lachnospiraceae bacterium]